MSEIKISRWLGFYQDVVDGEFHVFVDASSDAYGAVCFVRHVYVDKSVKVCFVLSRGLVAPPKCMTVPKLELMWLLLVTRPLSRDGGMAEDHGAPEAGQLSRAWTRGRKETKSRQRVSGAKSP